MKKATKQKSKAIARVPQSRQDAVQAIGRIGTLRSEVARIKALHDEVVRCAGAKLEEDTVDLMAELVEHEKGVQTWCEANRAALTNDGKVKFHDFGTGRINWRSLPASVSLKGVEDIIANIKKLGLKKIFLRVKEEVNKEAMLADPKRASTVAGVTIKSAGEVFEIEPLTIDAPSVMNG